jgi:hypothetical protein
MIHAYCHLRQAQRCFSISRVTRWTNCSTGEILTDIDADLKTARQPSACDLMDKLFEDFYPIIAVLVYLGKRDRRLMIDERTVIIQVCQTLLPDPRLTDKMINDRINEMKVPSPTRYKHLLTDLSGMEIQIQTLVLHAAKKLFASRKILNSTEKEGLEALNKALIRQGKPPPPSSLKASASKEGTTQLAERSHEWKQRDTSNH